MSSLCEEAKKLIEEIAADENIEDFTLIAKQQEFTGDNYLGRITRVIVTDKDAKQNERRINLILKRSPDQSLPRDTVPVGTFYEREMYAYTNILPVLYDIQEINDLPMEERFKCAKFFKGSMEEFKEMIILKDLSYEGYGMYDRRVSLDYARAEMAIKFLARFHATSFVLKNKDPKLFAKLSRHVANSVNYGKSFIELMLQIMAQAVEKLTNQALKSKMKAFGEICVTRIEELLDAPRTEPYNVICHGDSWINNMLFKTLNDKPVDVIFVDWQIVRLASPITDLVYLIFLSTDKAFRQKHLYQLLDVYYETLEKNVGKMGYDLSTCYPRKVFEKQRKELWTFGLIMGLVAIPFLLKKEGEEIAIEKLVEESNQGTLETDFNDEMIVRLTEICEDFDDMGYI